jgi:ferredoxin
VQVSGAAEVEISHMSKLEQHPTVQAARLNPIRPETKTLNQRELRQLCLEAGAADVGFVSIDRPELDSQRSSILSVFSATRTLISIVCSPARSMANGEFHATGDEVNEVARKIVIALAQRGVRALNPPMAFPMEMDRFPGKAWSISLKPLAEAAGMGKMGVHRNVIHPKFGNFILLGAVLVAAEIEEENRPISYNPCLECKLCVAACPVGAISPDGAFSFSACYTHNYREFMGGFTDWVENIAASRSAVDYRHRVTDSESASMWQSLAFGSNYKAAYCLSVCPAGEEVITPFLQDRPAFIREFLRPLQEKRETIYVQANSDAEDYLKKRFPHKAIRHVGTPLRPASIAGFIATMQHVFQPGKSKGIDAVYHFQFTGQEQDQCSVTISEQTITVSRDVSGAFDLGIVADSRNWLRFVRKEIGLVRLLLSLSISFKGNPKLLADFGRCFP